MLGRIDPHRRVPAQLDVSTMNLRFYIIGRERRHDEIPPAQERREPNGKSRYIGLRDSSVSRRHAEIYLVDGRIYLRDLGSKNGTYLLVNGGSHRHTEGYVDVDQEVRFGRYRCRVSQLLPDES